MPKNPQKFSDEDLSLLILEMQQGAFQYYVVARWACQQRLFDIVGTLLHHAFERQLKAGLVGDVSPSDLTSTKFGHDIPKLWGKIKAVYGYQDRRFDILATQLHEFEELRYPEGRLNNRDQIIVGGMGYFAPAFKFRDAPGKSFTLNLQDYEPWWQLIKELSSAEFDEHSMSIGQEAISIYRWKAE